MDRELVRSSGRNPFFGLLLMGGTTFVVTALLWGVAVLEGNLAPAVPASHATAVTWPVWLAEYGPWLMGLEFVALLAATAAFAYCEDARQAEYDAARSTATHRTAC